MPPVNAYTEWQARAQRVDKPIARLHPLCVAQWIRDNAPEVSDQSPDEHAATMVEQFGPALALSRATLHKSQHQRHSRGAVFYDEVCRAIERATAAAKQ